MNKTVNFLDEDIDSFIKCYETNLLDGIAPNTKIPVWVEYLKTKKYYRQNGISEDFFFNKRFNMTNEDLINLQKIVNRVKNGKKINRMNKTHIQGNILSNPSLNINGSTTFSTFDENEIITDKDTNKFELLSQVSSAMDDYYNKMKKSKERKLSWKNKDYKYAREIDLSNTTRNPELDDYRYQRDLAFSGTVQNVNNPYYIEQEYSERPQVEYDVQAFAKSPLYNMSKTNIINRIDEISKVLDNNNLITTDFQNGRVVPAVMTNKMTYSNNFDTETINKQLQNENYMGLKHQDPSSARFWQDQDILNPGSQTRKPAIKNKQPFENQFQYLDCNYNRVQDPRLIGKSSRMDNRSIMER
jgi:hypothetical protein